MIAGRLATLLLAAILAACSRAPGLDEIVQQGELRVALRHASPPLHDDYPGPIGFEYDLAKRFAAHLGVELKPIVIPDTNDLAQLLESGEGHLGAYAVPMTQRRIGELHFSRPYHRASPQLVYRYGNGKPKSLDDLQGHLEVAAGEGHAEQLGELRHAHPSLAWTVNHDHDTLGLLRRVADGELDYTIAYAHEVEIAQHLYPDLRTAFRVGEPRDFAWALPPDADDSLVFALQEFFDELESSGQLQTLLEQYFGHMDEFDFVEMREFQRRIGSRLPQYLELFQAAAGDDIDWRLLAAISYQESHWEPNARSPTGVRGMMMLTSDTAKQLGVTDRTDPEQSVRGGADYLRWVKGKIPARIAEPDRTWLALATYNVGFGHLEDARILTQRNGGDPDSWADVRRTLPLLARKQWYTQTKYGYARGGEAVAFVERIRLYYDILARRLQQEQAPERGQTVQIPRVIPLAF